MSYAQIILPLNLKGTFTYKVPEDFLSKIQIGMRVLVPFGGKKIYTGVVSDTDVEFSGAFVPKEIISLLDETPILPPEQLKFWQWISDYYLCNIGEIYRFAFPGSLKLESETYIKVKPDAKIDFEILDSNETFLLQALEVRQLLNLSEIQAFIPKKEIVKTINSLIDIQYIQVDEKITEKYKIKEVAYLRIPEKVLSQNISEVLSSLSKSPKQKDFFLMILTAQSEHPGKPIKKSEIFSAGNFTSSQLKSLVEKGFAEEYFLEKARLKSYDGETEELEQLSDSQQNAIKEINGFFAENKNVLLHGVTASGKTHVYLEKISEAVAEGKNVLFLLPEIAITKQIVKRLEKKYGAALGFYHQKLSDFERVEVWKKIKAGQINILIGTRSALFLPFQNVGLIIIDEEHDSAYKPREVSPFFNARDAAMVLGSFYKSKIILGSATPSVESFYLAKTEKLGYVSLSERFGNVKLPKFELIDFKEAQNIKNFTGNFSFKIIDEIKHQLENKKQVMVLHNRRGYANVVECEACGYVNYCSNCDVVMTYHKFSNEMKCHYCGQKAAKPARCPKCLSDRLNERGVGVEQIHEEVQKIFPEADAERMDVDAMRRKFAYERLYEKIESGEADIIVGTQMISKGLDFENIELVAIPRADALIYVQDFRAEERAFQLITQVSGRAGRVSGEGKVQIQTYNPEHPVFKLIVENHQGKIYSHFLEERKKFLYPPFVKLIMIEMKHRKEDKVNRAAQFMGSVLRKYLPEECVLGPEKSPIGKLNLLYQYQILLKLPRGKKYAEYKNLVLKSIEEFDGIQGYQSIKKLIFVDF